MHNAENIIQYSNGLVARFHKGASPLYVTVSDKMSNIIKT